MLSRLLNARSLADPERRWVVLEFWKIHQSWVWNLVDRKDRWILQKQCLLKTSNSPCSIREAVSAEIQPLCAERSWWWIGHLKVFFSKFYSNFSSKSDKFAFFTPKMRILQCLSEILEVTLRNVENRSGRTSIRQFPQRLSANRPLKIGFSEKINILKSTRKSAGLMWNRSRK